MSGTEPTAAEIEAAARALHAAVVYPVGADHSEHWAVYADTFREHASAVLAAVLPSVVARVRADIADEIEQARSVVRQVADTESPFWKGEDYGYSHAARVARGTGEAQ